MKIIENNLFAAIINNYSNKVTLIPHICNNIKKWGAGFVVPLAQHFPEAREAFYAEKNPKLGETQFVEAKNVPVVICNMFAQEGIGPNENGVPPIRYEALKDCMVSVINKAMQITTEGQQVVIAAPMFGAGLAGGDWEKISKLIYEHWSNIETTIYFLPQLLPRNLRAINVGTEIKIIPR